MYNKYIIEFFRDIQDCQGRLLVLLAYLHGFFVNYQEINLAKDSTKLASCGDNFSIENVGCAVNITLPARF